jgi:hypothetical protein
MTCIRQTTKAIFNHTDLNIVFIFEDHNTMLYPATSGSSHTALAAVLMV